MKKDLLEEKQEFFQKCVKRTKIGRGRGGRDTPSLDSVDSSLFAALFEGAVLFGFPVRCFA